MNNYYKISYEKEVSDSRRLAEIIENDGWINNSTIIVNCSPDYSSIATQIINHTLSHNNKHELYEQISLEMPYPIMSQIWNRETFDWEMYDKYLHSWFTKIDKSCQYLFIDSGVIRGKNFSKLKMIARDKIQYKLASLYTEESAIITPDYYVEKFSSDKQGGLLFEWENPLNPNWNY